MQTCKTGPCNPGDEEGYEEEEEDGQDYEYREELLDSGVAGEESGGEEGGELGREEGDVFFRRRGRLG